jgi:hypothetical protein
MERSGHVELVEASSQSERSVLYNGRHIILGMRSRQQACHKSVLHGLDLLTQVPVVVLADSLGR